MLLLILPLETIEIDDLKMKRFVKLSPATNLLTRS